MKVLVSGSSGLIGGALVKALESAGHTVVRLVRLKIAGTPNQVFWDVRGGHLDPQAIEAEAPDAVVHLAAESIATGRWTAAKKNRIRDSRVAGTRLLAESLASLSKKPKVLVSASAIGYYGDAGDTLLTESSPPGKGFLADVCKAWEAAAESAVNSGIRVVFPRIGLVLSNKGGALPAMLPPFRCGVGGVVGSGKQYWSWIDLDDLVGILLFAIDHANCSGPINAVAPNPVTNAEFTKALGDVLHRPTVLPLPAFAARLMLGEMAEELLLASTRVSPAKLKELGFSFRYPELEASLRRLLCK